MFSVIILITAEPSLLGKEMKDGNIVPTVWDFHRATSRRFTTINPDNLLWPEHIK